MGFEDQVIILFSATRGFLDNMELKEISRFEKMIIDHMNNNHKQILETIKK